MMKEFDTALVFLCSGSMKSGDKKLSYRIAKQLQNMGVADIGNLEMLSIQHLIAAGIRRKMIFISDCRSACVKVLMHGFEADQYLFFDVSGLNESTFSMSQFIAEEILPKISQKWNHIFSAANHSA